MYEIRRVLPEEIDTAIKLSEYAFRYRLEGEVRKQQASFMEDHFILGAFLGGEMVAKTHIIPHHVTIAGREFAMGGIASVATYPEHRRKGLVNRLMEKAVLQMRADRQVLSYLHPFDVSFYRKYGYEMMSSYKNVTVLAHDLKGYGGVKGTIKRGAPEPIVSALSEVYHRYCRKFTGMLVRSDKWWKNTLFGGSTAALYRNEQGEARGYLLYNIKDKTLNVEEYVYLDEDSRRGLWNFIANHDSMIDKAVITLVLHDEMSFLFRNPEVRTDVVADFMARVILVKEFLEQYTDGNKGSRLVIGVADDLAEWNSGVYYLAAGRVEFAPVVAHLVARAAESQGGVNMDIRTFSAALLGVVSCDFLCESGLITGREAALAQFKSSFSIRPSAFLDYF